MEDEEIIQNLDLLVNLDTLEEEEIWDEVLDHNSELNHSEESL